MIYQLLEIVAQPNKIAPKISQSDLTPWVLKDITKKSPNNTSLERDSFVGTHQKALEENLSDGWGIEQLYFTDLHQPKRFKAFHIPK